MSIKTLVIPVAAMVTILSLIPVRADAVIVNVEPDAFANGTDISNAYAGVTLSVIDGGGGAVFSRTDGSASTGSRTFGNSSTDGVIANLVWFEGNGFNAPVGPGPLLRVDFATATDFVAIDIINQDNFDGGVLRAFDASDMEIAVVMSTVTSQFGINPAPIELSVSLATTDIAYVTIAGQSAQDPVHLDNLRFNLLSVSAPEPATFGLLLVGVVGVMRRRRFSA